MYASSLLTARYLQSRRLKTQAVNAPAGFGAPGRAEDRGVRKRGRL